MKMAISRSFHAGATQRTQTLQQDMQQHGKNLQKHTREVCVAPPSISVTCANLTWKQICISARICAESCVTSIQHTACCGAVCLRQYSVPLGTALAEFLFEQLLPKEILRAGCRALLLSSEHFCSPRWHLPQKAVGVSVAAALFLHRENLLAKALHLTLLGS